MAKNRDLRDTDDPSRSRSSPLSENRPLVTAPMIALAACVLVLVTITGLVIGGLREEVDREVRAALEVQGISQAADRIRDLQLEIQQAGRVGPRRTEAFTNAQADARESLSRLAAIEGEGDEGTVPVVARNLDAYETAVDREIRLTRSGFQGLARDFRRRTVDPAFRDLSAALDDGLSRESSETGSALRTADLGTALSLGFAAIALLGTLFAFERYRRRLVEQRNTELQRIAHQDQLTGLPNRRSFLLDLRQELEVGRRDPPLILILFDLDGFKSYNDTFGHSEGDLLLERLGANLLHTLSGEGHGRAYRLGGDEFCVLTRCDVNQRRSLVARCASALSETGEGFSVRTSYGSVEMPTEAHEVSSALRVADQRLYLQKERKQTQTIKGQTRDLVLKIMSERDPALQNHMSDVSGLAAAVARRLGMRDARFEDLIRAAELHDIGKIAVPESILHKPALLLDSERSFMRRHTLIGQRMLESVPALKRVGRIVRSCHERWDGAGYPDGLAGDEIPLEARIIFVCDAYDAMTSERPYQAAMSADAALEELHGCAGTQFDPMVVEVFASVLSETQRLDLDALAAETDAEIPSAPQPALSSRRE